MAHGLAKTLAGIFGFGFCKAALGVAYLTAMGSVISSVGFISELSFMVPMLVASSRSAEKASSHTALRTVEENPQSKPQRRAVAPLGKTESRFIPPVQCSLIPLVAAADHFWSYGAPIAAVCLSALLLSYKRQGMEFPGSRRREQSAM